MNSHKPVCGPGRAWMQSTFCYLIGWGRFTNTPVYSSNGSLYSDSFWQTYLVRRRYFSPQIIAQIRLSKSKWFELACLYFANTQVGRNANSHSYFLGRCTAQWGCFLVLLFLIRAMNPNPYMGPDPARGFMSPTIGPAPNSKRCWIWDAPLSKSGALSVI